ncbi:MAG: DUF6531 domain-containing protein, partial [Acidobacteria bacterium]|nr:DUF6531 domain-containing protein [Acidobacteriota bacterium]
PSMASPTGTTALYATYFGGADDDDVVGLFVPQDAGATKDNIYLALSTTSRNLPVSATAFLRTYNGGASDGYLARLSSNGAELVSATYLGGAGDDKLGAMTVDATGVVAVVFSSTSEAWGPADQRQKTGHSRSAGIQSAFDPYVQIQLMLASMQNALLHRQLEPTCEGAGNQLHYVSMSGAMLAAVGNTSISNPSTCAANSTLVGKTGKTLATLAYTSTPPPPAIVFPPISKYRIQGIVGDPISTASGELHDTHVDISLGGPMRLIFARHYSSRLGALGVFGSLGNNWMHLYEQTADVQDNVATVTLFEGRQLTFRRASAAAPWQLEGAAPTGYVLQSAAGGLRLLSYIARTILQFNAAGQLTRIEDRNGNSVVLTPSAIGPTLADDGLGRTLQFTYAAGHLTRVTDQGGRSISFSYTGDDLTTVTGLNGRLTDYTYTSAGAQTGLMTSKTPPLGNKLLTWAYDAQGRVMEETNSLGGKLRLDYGADGRTTITDAAGKATIHTPAAGQALTSMVDSAGKPSELSYDTSNRRTGVTDRDGNKFGVTYHSPTGYIASLTDAAGATMYTYAAQVQAGWTHYNLAKITYPDGAAESFTFDARGNITAGTMRDGKERKHTFNARGQALTGTNGSGATVTYTYGDDATLATATLPGGEQRTYGYDSLKRLVKVTHPDGASQAFSHTASSLPAGSVNELGGVTEFSYTGNDQVATRTDPLGRITTLTYDTEGRQTSFTDGNGAVTSYLYAANGKLAGLTEPSGRTRRFEYDSSDNVRAVSDDLGKWQEFEYSSEGKMTAIKDALDRVTRAEYRNLQPVTRTLPSGATVAYRYGASNQLTGYTDPVGRTLEFTRDSLGRITSAELPGDATAQWQWSTDGYISQATDPNGGVWKFEYDNLGRITAQVDPLNRRVSYTSDNRGRIARSTNGETSVQFRYGATGQLLGKTYSDGTAMTLQRDALGRLVKGDGIELEWDALRTTRSNGLGIQRDAAGRIT